MIAYSYCSCHVLFQFVFLKLEECISPSLALMLIIFTVFELFTSLRGCMILYVPMHFMWTCNSVSYVCDNSLSDIL